MYERRGEPLVSRVKWILRVLRSLRSALLVLMTALLIGVMGYRFIGHIDWVDSLLEASMILAGMGPSVTLRNDAVKIFASVYALFSGFVFLAAAGIVIAPVLHRLMHSFHQDEK